MKSNPLFLLPALLLGSNTANAQEPLNFLFISSDDLCSAMNAFGDPRVHTPNLDRLAQKAVVFNRAYNQSPLSGPSRASIMTGYRPDRTGVHDLSGKFRYAMPDAVTMPQLFKNNGYYVARIGKIYHAGVPSDIGLPGSDDPQSWGITYNPVGRDRTDEYLLQGDPGPGTWLSLDCSDDELTDAISANLAIALLRGRYSNVGSAYRGPARKDVPPRRSKQPFFMAVGFYRPHVPYIAPKKYFDMYPDVEIPEKMEEEWLTKPAMARRSQIWNGGASEEDCKNAIRAYYASVTFIDAQIGKLLDALEELDLMDNTVIVFWSDHGYMLGEHGLWQKQNLFEQTAHQPLLIYAPGFEQGKGCNAIVEMIDIYPTLADLAGLQAPADLDGVSMKPLLEDTERRWDRPAFTQQARTLFGDTAQEAAMRNISGPDALFMFNPSIDDKHTTIFGRSIRTDRYRYTEWDEGREGCELYDYDTDPEEHINLAVGHPEYMVLIKELSAKLRSNYSEEAIKTTQETIARNRAAALQQTEPLYPAVTY